MPCLARSATPLLNLLPPWLARFAPRPVLMKALEQLQCREALAIETTRHKLQIQELKEQSAMLEKELGS